MGILVVWVKFYSFLVRFDSFFILSHPPAFVALGQVVLGGLFGGPLSCSRLGLSLAFHDIFVKNVQVINPMLSIYSSRFFWL